MPGETQKDQERLAKLWDAYEAQENEYEGVLKKISVLEAKIKEKDRINETLRKVVEARDQELRELEIKSTALEQSLSRAEPKVEELTHSHKVEKDRYGKLFAIAEELEEELTVSRREIEARDEWYKRNISVLENLAASVQDRAYLVESAKNLKETLPTLDISKMKPKDGDSATFTKVAEEKDTAETKEVKISSAVPSTSEDMIDVLLKIPGMDKPRAEALKGAGFDSLEKIRESTTRDLSEVEGISPTLARKIKTELLELD